MSLPKMSDKVKSLIQYTKTSGKDYNGKRFSIGYQSVTLDGTYFRGQRDCIQRLGLIKKWIDFKGKTVLDIGCYIGGMLHPLSQEIKEGVGLDLDHRNINAANRIARYNKSSLSFYVFDLDKENLELIGNFLDSDIDIVFLLSICMWIKKWKELIDYIHTHSSILVFESNGTNLQQEEQEEYLRQRWQRVDQIQARSVDDPGQKNRKMFVCRS